MIYKMTLKDSADEMTFDLLEVPIVDKDIEGAVDNVTLDGNQYTDYLWLKKQFVQKWSILCDDEYTRLRGFYTRQFENADVPSYRLYYGDDIIRNSTLSGERIELNISGVTDGTMSLTQMDGNTIQNGTPVTGRQTVTVVGKNLWGGLGGSYSRSTGGIDFMTNSDGTITASGLATSAAFSINNSLASSNNIYTMLKAGTYYLSTENTPPTGVSARIGKLSDATTLAESPHSFTLTEDTDVYVSLRVASGTNISNGITVKPMVERNNQATTYEPYHGQSYEINLGPIELCKIGTYQDRIYKDGEKWYLHKEVGKVVLNGTEAWVYNGTDRVFVVSDLVDYMRTGFVPMSDYYTGQEITEYSQLQDMHIAFLTSANSRTVVKNTNYTTANDFKTWLSTHPTTVYYALATPITTEITNEALVEELEALQDGAISVGLHNIYTDTPNALPTLTFDLTEYLSKSTTIIPETPVRLTLTDGGVINACGCRKDVQLTMRETIE